MIKLVHPAHAWMISALLAAMDEADFAELASLTDLRPADALGFSLAKSPYSFAAFDDEDQPIALGGVRTFGFVSRPLIWMIAATSHLERQKKAFLQQSRLELAAICRMFPCLQTAVDYRYVKSIRWLEWLGFKKEEETEILNRICVVMSLGYPNG